MPLSDLAPMDVANRMDRVRAAMEGAECDSVLVTSLTNIRYLTGFSGSAALLAIRPDGALFVTDGRYAAQAPEQIDAAGVTVDIHIGPTAADQQAAIGAFLASAPRLGLEAAHVSWAAQRRYLEAFSAHELVPTTDLVETLRWVKDAGELDRMAAAASIADHALIQVLPMLVSGATELEVARTLDEAMRTLGASAPSFDTIVAAGDNGAKPHAQPGDRRIAEGDLVVMDFGAVVDGYCSDMTRTFQIGDVGPQRQRMWEVVADAQRAGVEAVRAGVAAVDVDTTCRQLIEAAGWGESFAHGTGHGVGLDIHEDPRVSAASTATLAAGQVVTVEPGVYLAGLGGVRIEDTVVVTETGCRTLTLSPKEPVLN